MQTTTYFECFSAANYQDLGKLINGFLAKYSNWELISVSHVLFPGGVSAACVFKMKGT